MANSRRKLLTSPKTDSSLGVSLASKESKLARIKRSSLLETHFSNLSFCKLVFNLDNFRPFVLGMDEGSDLEKLEQLYEVSDRVLGEGTNAKVLLGHVKLTREAVAIKVLKHLRSIV